MTTPISWDVYARDRASRTFNNVGSAAHHSSGLVGKFGATVVGVLTGQAIYNGGRKLITFLGDTVASASDLAETASKATQIFGEKQAHSLEKWADAADKAIGQSKQTALDGAATFGVFGKSAGLAGQDLVDFAQQNVDLAADMASFANTSPEEAIVAISSALRGEQEPIRQYGVLLDDATLRQQAMKMGLIKTTKDALTPQQKVLAAHAQILKQTSDQQGDFERTSSGLANQQRILSAEFANTKAEIGQRLLPVALDLTHWATRDGVPAFEDLAHWIGDEVGPVMHDLTKYVGENKDKWFETSRTIAGDVLPPLQDLVGVGGEVLSFIMDLPGPVKEFGGEIALAAIAVPRLSSALTGMKLSKFITDVSTAETRTAAFGRAAKGAAGVAGVAALIDSSHQANDAVSALEETFGGAAVGGSMAGPWGAVVGGSLGGLHSAYKLMFKDVEYGSQVMTDGKGYVADYAGTFDDLTGSITKATAAEIVHAAEMSGALAQARNFGITSRELSHAVLGNRDAIASVNEKLERGKTLTIAYRDEWGRSYTMQVNNQKQLKSTTEALQQQGYTIDDVKKATSDLAGQKAILDFIGKQRDAWKSASKVEREHILASQDLTAVYKNFPKSVATKIDAVGIVPTAKGVADLAVKYDAVDKRHIEALIKATGTDVTVRQVKDVIDKLDYLRAHNRVDTYVTTHINQVKGHDIGGISGRVGAPGHGGQTAAQASSFATARSEFASGFGSLSSIFGMSGDDAPTVDSILNYGASQQTKAEQAKADIVKLTQMGLSPALIKQLQASGEGGLAVLHTLATGANAQQIALVNAQAAATSSAFGSFTSSAANAVFGFGSSSALGGDGKGYHDPYLTGDLRPPGKGHGGRREGLERALGDLVDELRGGKIEGTLKLGTQDLVAALKRYRKQNGPLGLG